MCVVVVCCRWTHCLPPSIQSGRGSTVNGGWLNGALAYWASYWCRVGVLGVLTLSHWRPGRPIGVVLASIGVLLGQREVVTYDCRV